jgi:hypothetical protein
MGASIIGFREERPGRLRHAVRPPTPTAFPLGFDDRVADREAHSHSVESCSEDRVEDSIHDPRFDSRLGNQRETDPREPYDVDEELD